MLWRMSTTATLAAQCCPDLESQLVRAHQEAAGDPFVAVLVGFLLDRFDIAIFVE